MVGAVIGELGIDKLVDEQTKGIDSRDSEKEQSVIFSNDDAGVPARVTSDEEQVHRRL